MKVRLTKILGKPDSSTPVGYWVEGWEHPLFPAIGHPYSFDRPIKTSLGEHFDWFKTTTVTAIDGDILVTRNSQWKREVVK